MLGDAITREVVARAVADAKKGDHQARARLTAPTPKVRVINR